ncbi:MAG: addiction module toxin RelE [Nanoarchaeota archaeon]
MGQMHNSKASEHLQEVMRKLSKKNKSLYEQLLRKIDEIRKCYDVEHYKNLRYNMKDSKRVHIGHFVLVFQYDKTNDMINFDDFDHHDVIYEKR